MNTAWMKGVPYRLVETPIDPVCPEDDRPVVRDLIHQYREKIDKIANLLKDHPLYEPETKHDDLWILRFYLTHGKTKRAAEAAKRTLEYRQQEGWDAKDVRHINFKTVDPEKNPAAKFLSYCDESEGGFLAYTCLEETRGVGAFIHLASIDFPQMVKDNEPDFWLQSLCHASEFCFQWCDYLTRTTGRLTKSFQIVDMTNYSLTKHFCLENTRRTGAAARRNSEFYPQVQDSAFVIHSPSWIHIPWSIFKPLLPARTARKIVFLTQHLESESSRKKIYRFASNKHLPAFLGGEDQRPLSQIDFGQA